LLIIETLKTYKGPVSPAHKNVS